MLNWFSWQVFSLRVDSGQLNFACMHWGFVGGCYYCRAVETGGQGGRGSSPHLGSSVNPIPTRGADYVHQIATTSPPSLLATALYY